MPPGMATACDLQQGLLYLSRVPGSHPLQRSPPQGSFLWAVISRTGTECLGAGGAAKGLVAKGLKAELPSISHAEVTSILHSTKASDGHGLCGLEMVPLSMLPPESGTRHWKTAV